MTNPLLTETPIVTINGVEKNLPRLSLSATFSIISLVKDVITPDTIKLISSLNKESESELDRGVEVVSTLFGILDGSEEKIYKVIAKVLNESIEDVEELALEEIVEVALAFKDHPDVGFFTKKLPALIKTQSPVAVPTMKN